MHTAGSFFLHSRHDVGIEVEGNTYLGMAQSLARYLRMKPGAEQVGCKGRYAGHGSVCAEVPSMTRAEPIHALSSGAATDCRLPALPRKFPHPGERLASRIL